MMKRELWSMPLVIIILSISMFLIASEVNHPFLMMLFPQAEEAFEYIKIYFTAFVLIYLGGLFINTSEINNYLLSRVLSQAIIMMFNVFLYKFSLQFGHLGLIILMVSSVYIGQYASYVTQKYSIKNSDVLAILLQTIIAYLLLSFY